MNSSRKIVNGVVWTMLLNIVNGVYGFISVPILIAHFGKDNYGLIGLAMSVNVYLRLMDMGMNSTNVRFFSSWITKGNYDDVNKLFHTNLSFYGLIGLLNALILILISFFTSTIFHLNPDQDIVLKHLFYILSISAFISWFTSCFDQLLRGNEYVGWTQKFSILPKILQLLILALTVILNFSIELYYMLTTFSLFLIIPFLYNKIKKTCPYIHFKIGWDIKILKEILPYSINIFFLSIFQFSANHLRPIILGMRGSIESVADYRVLNGIIGIVVMFGGAFTGVILPSATKAISKGDIKAENKIAYTGTKYISILLCFYAFGIISVSQELLTLYVGKDFIYLVPWLILWLVITTLAHNQAISSLILGGKDIRPITQNSILSSIACLAACWYLVPIYGVGGTVIGYGIYYLFQLSFFYIYYWPKKMGINSWVIFYKSYFPYLIIGFVSSSVYLIDFNFQSTWSMFFIKGTSFFILYSLIVLITLNSDDKKFILNFIRRKK